MSNRFKSNLALPHLTLPGSETGGGIKIVRYKDSETGLLVCMYVLSRRIHVYTCFSACITVVLLITHVQLMLNVVSCPNEQNNSEV